jgi:hypothetical protein
MSQQLLSSPYELAYEGFEIRDDTGQGISKARRRGIGLFLRRNITVSLALVLGLACIGIVVQYTQWFSVQVPHCPDWSLDCNVLPQVDLIYQNFGAVQGVVTAVYSIGLAALAFSAHSFSESALWPLLHQQPFSIRQMDTFLDASRGSIPSTPGALLKARTLDSAVVLLLTAAITLTPLAAAPVLGKVYNRANMTTVYKSQLQGGGGIGVYWVQSNPPGPYRERANAMYTSWQGNLSSEPLPEYRHWFIDRNLMAKRGNFTVETVRIKQDIECRGWAATPNKKRITAGREDFWVFNTSMPTRTNYDGRKTRKLWQHDQVVRVRDSKKLAVWVHNYTFDNPNKTIVTLIFAALEGDIEGGITTTTVPKGAGNKNVSSIACNVAVEVIEDTLTVGEPPGPAKPINSMAQIKDPGSRNKKNELALWFAVSPVANGAYVYGTQPMYTYKQDWIPERYTSTDSGDNGGWTIDYIKNFIKISTSASILGEVEKWPKGTTQFFSNFPVVKTDPRKTILLTILPLIILVCGSVLSIWNVKMYKAMAIPVMRKATLGEVIQSSQTTDILASTAVDHDDPTNSSGLEKLEVIFREAETGIWGFYRAKGQGF